MTQNVNLIDSVISHEFTAIPDYAIRKEKGYHIAWEACTAERGRIQSSHQLVASHLENISYLVEIFTGKEEGSKCWADRKLK